MTNPWKKIPLLMILSTLVISIGSLVATSNNANSLSYTEFQPGRIIDDEIFYDNTAMGSAKAVQDFIISHTPAYCDTQGTSKSGYSNLTNAEYAQQVRGWPGPPYVCLQNYHENPTTGETSFEKGGGYFEGGQNAGQIIWDAAQKYRINPQVLLVLLRKESLNLFSDYWPMKSQYKYAMGYACPDSGPNYSANCDDTKAGFYKQVNLAAWQLRYYYNNMGSYNYIPGRWNTIQFNPQPSCGTKNVYIENAATASLYIYTPYTPNDAALRAYPGEAPCGAYGNRNFWFMFNEWFGTTLTNNIKVSFKSHISFYGWTGFTNNRGVTGFVGQGKPMESFKINGDVEYSSYNNSNGWQPTINNGMISGTTGQGIPINALKISPTNTLASDYDIFYRVHVSYIGWMGWTKNGQPAGVVGGSNNKIEALEIIILPKGSLAPGISTDSFRDLGDTSTPAPVSISMSSHVGTIGWQPSSVSPMSSGTTEMSKPIEALKLSLNNSTTDTGGVVYSSHLSGIGWTSFKSNGEISGTVGEFRQMEAFRVALVGPISDKYDVWYRGYVKYIGWMGWTKNNQPAGSVGAGRQLEAIETRILPKGSPALFIQTALYNPTNQSVPPDYTLNYSAHVSYVGWLNNLSFNSLGGTNGQSKSLEAIRINSISSAYGELSLSCSAYSKGIGWVNNVAIGGNCGTTGKSSALEAVNLSLSGSAANQYTLQYRTHIAFLGWQPWVNSGLQSGTPNSGKGIEAIEFKIIPR